MISKWNKILASEKLIYINNWKGEEAVSIVTEPTVNADLKMLATNFKESEFYIVSIVYKLIYTAHEETGMPLHSD